METSRGVARPKYGHFKLDFSLDLSTNPNIETGLQLDPVLKPYRARSKW